MNPDSKPAPFLRLPTELRQRIYSYLLAPHPDEHVTTINYDLDWPFLEHPTSTTFTPHQLDRCTCPQQRPCHEGSGDHIYTRYACSGPVVKFKPRSGPLWILEQPGPAFNVLRPATEDELQKRPDAALILVNKLIYQEAIPILYNNRNFLFLTSICSRGRYQAYTTQTWLSRLSPFARSNIMSLSLIVQRNEEDCRDIDVEEAHNTLCRFIIESLPRFQTLYLHVWSTGFSLHPFSILSHRELLRVFMERDTESKDLHMFLKPRRFLQKSGGIEKAEQEEPLYTQSIGELEEEDWEIVSPLSVRSINE